jgi:polyisoprenoid-binding protein YceI
MKPLLLVACLLAVHGAVIPAQAKVYTALKGESTLSYHLIHKMHEVTGVSKNFKCVVDLAADSSKSRVYVKGAVSEFNSGNSSRDATMLEVVEATKYPAVEFMSDSVRREGHDWRVFGRLTFHGVKRPINFVVRPEVSGSKVRVRGMFKVSLTEYKVERPRLLMIPVDDELQIEIDVVSKVEENAK